MSDNKINLPSSGGGLVRYAEEGKSKVMFSPWVVVVAMGVVTLLGILLYKGIL